MWSEGAAVLLTSAYFIFQPPALKPTALELELDLEIIQIQMTQLVQLGPPQETKKLHRGPSLPSRRCLHSLIRRLCRAAHTRLEM